MDPSGILVAHLRGLDTPELAVILWNYLPNYVCALIAVIPPKIMVRLGHHVQRARELGSYRLVELIGRGGMGEVWRATHRMLARPAAIKLIKPEILGAPGAAEASVLIERFRREAEAASGSAVAPHDPALRFRRDPGRHLLLRHGAARRARPRDAGAPVRAGAAGARHRAPAPGLPLARRGARPRPDPPRRQAGQHLPLPAGPGIRLHEGARLRAGQV